MTTSVLHTLQGSAFGSFLARAFEEFQAFFEEAGVALARANKDQPFGL
jgi:hypothetical protein